MKRLLNASWLLLLLRIALGGIFLYAGVQKLLNAQEFADSIATYRMLPLQILNPMALGLPPLEIILGLLLLIGWQTRMPALGVTLLLGIFSMALGQAILRGLTIDCGCFGTGEPSPLKLWLSLGRDLLLFAAALWLCLKVAKSPRGD